MAEYERNLSLVSSTTILCTACQDCLEGFEQKLPDMSLEHHPKMADFLIAVDLGCAFCTQLWHEFDVDGSILRQFSGAIREAGVDEFIDYSELGAVYSRRGAVPLPIGTYGEYKNFQLVFDREVAMQVSGQIPDKEISLTWTFVPASDMPRECNNGDDERHDICAIKDGFVPGEWSEVLEQAARWINTCTQHEACSNGDEKQWTPRRLLDLSDLEETQQVRIIDTTDSPVNQPYFTLSHCWGNADFISLRTDNMESFQQGLKMDALPPTFRDAIAICKSLDVNYLWIDSLCIIQNDAQDWAEQSLKMCDVYGRAKCNIAADASPNAHVGIFRRQPPSTNAVMEITLDKASAEERRSPLTWIQPGTYIVVDRFTVRRLGSFEPLNKRAWVFQERLLARGVLHFATDQLLWECRSTIATQAYPHGIPRDAFEDGNFKALQIFDGAKDPRQVGMGCYRDSDAQGKSYFRRDCKVCDRWERLVRTYSEKQITHPDDRPIAFAGLAAHVKAKGEDIYMMGMWMGHLMRQLCWHMLAYPHEAKALEVERAASKREFSTVSWLSVNGRIHCLYVAPEWYWCLVKAIGGPEEPKLTGKGWEHPRYFVIEGYFHPVQLIPKNDDGKPNWDIVEPTSGLSTSNMPQKLFISYPDYGRDDLPLEHTSDKRFYLLPMAMIGPFLSIAVCLLLEEHASSKDQPTPVCRRIAMCHLTWIEDDVRALLQSMGHKFNERAKEGEKQIGHPDWIREEVDRPKRTFVLV